MPLRHAQVGDASAIVLQKIHRAEDSRVGQPGAPVPTHHAVRLAQMRIAAHAIGCAEQVGFLILLSYVSRGRVAHDAQLIVLRQQIGHVKFVAQVHIVGLGHVRTVEIDAAKRVQALKYQIYRTERFPIIKRARKGIVVLRKIQINILVLAYVWVGQKPVIHVKERIDRAGNLPLYVVSVARHAPCSAKIVSSHKILRSP